MILPEQFWRNAYDTQQRTCARWLRLGWGVFGGLLFTTVLAIMILIAGDTMTSADNIGVKAGVEFFDKALDNMSTRFDLPRYNSNVWTPYIFAFLFGAVPFWWAGGTKAKEWAASYFPSYNPVGFHPVGRPVTDIGADHVLPWASNSVMDSIFKQWRIQMTDPAQTGTGQRPLLRPWKAQPPPIPFDYYLLLGRPGAGKSRLAEHLARQLGQRDIVGDRGKGEIAKPAAAAALAKGERRRRLLWFAARLHNDPWDSGRIRPPKPGENVAVPLAFANWRPARPTILWMDDPTADTAKEWLKYLTDQASNYRHPVRLVIANQTRLEGVMDPQAQNIHILRKDTYFTPEQILALAKADSLNPFDKEKAAQVHALTDGNPLLVELAFEQLRRGKAVDDLNREGIIAERVIRVYNALKSASAELVTANALRSLALATLAGPGCLRKEMEKVLPMQAPGATALQRAFPVEANRIDLSIELPMVKPEMIGDAFVRHIVKTESATIAADLNTALFAHDRDRWLAVVQRLGRGSDATADAFSAPPTGFAAVEAEFRDAAIQGWLTLGHFGLRDVMETALRIDALMSALPDWATQQAAGERLLAWHMAAVDADWAARCASGAQWRAALAAGKTTEEAATEQERAATQPLKHRFMQGNAIAAYGLMLAAHRFADSGVGEFTVEDARERMDFADELVKVSRVAEEGSTYKTLAIAERIFAGVERMSQASEAAIFSEFARERSWHFANRIIAQQGVRTSLARQASHFTQDQIRISVWANRMDAYSENGNKENCRARVELVETIAGQKPWVSDREVQLDRAFAWRNLALAENDNPSSCRDAVNRVEAITARPGYTDDHDMQIQRVRALCNLAQADLDIESCRDVVNRVETITAQPVYANDRDMQVERVYAWSNLAYTERATPESCRDAVNRVEAMSAPPDYAGDRDIQFRRAVAWRYLTGSTRNDSVAYTLAFAKLERICAPWQHDAKFADELAQARSYRSG